MYGFITQWESTTLPGGTPTPVQIPDIPYTAHWYGAFEVWLIPSQVWTPSWRSSLIRGWMLQYVELDKKEIILKIVNEIEMTCVHDMCGCF